VKLPKVIRQTTIDTATTVGGFIVAAAVGGASAYLTGQVTKEGVLASAIVAGGGWFLNRGNKTAIQGER